MINMSKKNVRPNSGKQLYLNQIFYKGMLYTSSEMQEGYARVIDNYDIAPTGDSAVPRYPLIIEDEFNKDLGRSKYIKPIKFKQDSMFSYIKFNKTITEKEYAKNEIASLAVGQNNRTIEIYRRDTNALNTNTFNRIAPITYLVKGDVLEENDPSKKQSAYIEAIEKNEFLEINLEEKFIRYTQVYNDNLNEITTRYITSNIYQSTIDKYSEQYTTIPTVIDGDTFKYGNKKYRLYGIDCSEIGTEWSEYAKKTLQIIFDDIARLGDSFKITLIRKGISYDRTVALCLVSFSSLPDYYIDLSKLLLSLGVATIRYLDRNQDPTLFDTYMVSTWSAQDKKYKIFSDTDYDPYYVNKVQGSYESEGDNLQIDDTMYIDVVKLSDEYQISAKSKSQIDFVDCVYIDYLDAIAFIGRVVNKESNFIIYKGPILLKCYGDAHYQILLPSNKGEGFTPGLVDAVTGNAYNILNSNMIDINNNLEETVPLSILGVSILKTEDDSLIEPPVIVTKGVVGQTVLLKAIINENGYYTYNNITTTDMFGFEINISPIFLDDIKLSDGFTITKSYGDTNLITSQSLQLSSLLSELTTSQIESILTKYSTTIDLITWNTIKDNISVYATAVTLINENGKRIPVNINSGFYIEKDIKPVWTGSMLELKTNYEINSADANMLYINFYNNFSSIGLTFNENTELVTRTEIPEIRFYSKWGVANFGTDSFVDIEMDTLLYIKEPSSSTLTKIGNWNGSIKRTDLLYNIGLSGNLLFKFSIQPRIKNKLDDSCPSAIADIVLKNKYQEMYQISNSLQTQVIPEYISDSDLRKNMDIKNATRIGVFNRQIFLYGPYTISNVLFFSKFEQFDYFAFPSNVIEVEEPITYVYNYKDSLVIFGKNNLYMLSGGVAVTECTLVKLYENLTTHLPDVKLINTVGNNLIFFNNGMGYVIAPNIYVDNSSNIRVYKLTENISNFLYNPEEYIRNRIQDIPIDMNLTFTLDYYSYIQNNEIVIGVNIDVFDIGQFPVWLIYNQDYKYWRMYSSTLFNKVICPYVCEPNFNKQFIVENEGVYFVSYFKNVMDSLYQDIHKDTSFEPLVIQTMINTGYLSVDTMNDKRFKDIIIELDNIDKQAELDIDCEFFIDGSPILLSDSSVLVVDKVTGEVLNVPEKELSEFKHYESKYINSIQSILPNTFGKSFLYDSSVYTTIGRTHIRIPVFGKGRLPLFILKIKSNRAYEFINYAMIYKEKNINRRS